MSDLKKMMDNQESDDQTAKVSEPLKKEKERLPLLMSPPQQSTGETPPAAPSSEKLNLMPRKPNGYQDIGGKNDVEVPDDDDLDELAMDRGYAWFIVLGSFWAQLLAGGLVRCDGIYFLEFEERFGESAQVTAWPGAICFTLQCFIVPVAAWGSNRFSERTCVIVGTFLAVLGAVLTAFAPNIYMLFLSYSILQGCGRGLISGPGIFIVNVYFDKFRAIALGLSTAGTGVGTFALVPLVDLLFRKFGYRNAFLCTAGISATGFLVAALFRPMSMHKEMVRKRRLKSNPKANPSARSDYNRHNLKPMRGSVNDAYTREPAYSGEHYTTSEAEGSLQTSQNGPNSIMTYGTPSVGPSINATNSDTTMDIKSSGDSHKKTNWFFACVRVVFPVEGKKEGSSGEKRPLFHWALFKDFPFLLLCTSMTFFSLAQNTILTFMPAIGEEQGLSELRASLLLSVTGVGDTVGRIGAGLLLDIPSVRPMREIVYASVLFFAAGAALVIPFTTVFQILFCAGILFGIMTGACSSQRATVLAALLGKETVNSAFGILTSFRGIGSFIGPPLTGALKDISGDFKVGYYVSSANMAGAGTFIVISICLFALRRRRQAGSGNYENMDENSDEPERTINGDRSPTLTRREEQLLTDELTSSLLNSGEV